MKTILIILGKVGTLFLAVVWLLTAGPRGRAQAKAGPPWQEITPQGGTIRVIAPVSSQTFYVGTNDGVFRWSKNVWSRVSAGLDSPSITSLVVDPSDPLRLYASTDEDAGVYKSTDGGDSWALAAEGLSGQVRSLAINPDKGVVVYAQTASQVYRTDDGGVSWQLKSQGILTGDTEGDLLSLQISRSNPSSLYVSELSGSLYKTMDGGEAWVKTTPLLGERARTLEIDPNDANQVYAGTVGDGIYLTDDGGQTWVKRNEGMPNDGNGQTLNAILIDPSKTNVLYASMNGLGLYRSTDSGLHWARLTSTGQYSSPLALAPDPTASNTVYAGYEGAGLFKSSNGGKSWTDMNHGLNVLATRILAPDPQNGNVVYAGASSAGLFKTRNLGQDWTPLRNGLEFEGFVSIAIDPTNSRNIYLGADGAGLYRSTDAGMTWAHENIGPGVVEVDALAVDPVSPNIVYAGAFDRGVFKSMDYGQTWEPTGLQEISTLALAIDPVHSDTIYAGADGVWKSTDGGANFEQINDGFDDGCANRLVVDKVTPSTIYAVGCDSGLYKSTNGGLHWVSVVIPGSSSRWVSAFAVDPRQPQLLYAGDGKHIFRSMDAGETWSLFDSGLPSPWEVDQLEVSSTRGCVFAGGFYYGGLFMICP